jgi:haloalkane dehalogenase
MINPRDHMHRRRLRVMGRNLSAVDEGRGPIVVFLHGNVIHSYAWRNIIPYLAQRYRCIALDNIGMGGSDLIQPSGPGTYSFDEVFAYTDAALEVADLDDRVILVGHELGALQAIRWARRHADRVAGLVLLEGAFRLTSLRTLPPVIADILTRLRSDGDDLVLREDVLFDRYLPLLTSRAITPPEHDAYVRPYRVVGESRRPLLSLARSLPVDELPGPLDDEAGEARLWCAQNPIRKLVVGGLPGFLSPPAVLGASSRWANVSVASVRGKHYVMEDSPARIAALLLDWFADLPN